MKELVKVRLEEMNRVKILVVKTTIHCQRASNGPTSGPVKDVRIDPERYLNQPSQPTKPPSGEDRRKKPFFLTLTTLCHGSVDGGCQIASSSSESGLLGG